MSNNEKPIQHPEYEKSPMSRRTFFRRAVTAAGIGAAAGYVAFSPENWPGSMKDATGLLSKPKIKPLRLTDFRVSKPADAADVAVAGSGTIEQRLRKALDGIGGIKHYVKPGDIVLVKPNVAFDRSPNLGATTHPDICEALVRMLLVDCRAQEVRVADNPIEQPADCFAKSGVGGASEKGGGRIYLPDSNAFKVLNTPGAKLIENWKFFYRPLTNVDKVIGLSPVKDHNLCSASMGIKNWYGLLGGRRNQFHQDIHEIVSDLSLMIKPTFTVLDGRHVLMKNGPTGGDPSNVKPGEEVVAAVDPVAGDAWAFEHLLERGKDYPQYLYKAVEKGSGSLDLAKRVRLVL